MCLVSPENLSTQNPLRIQNSQHISTASQIMKVPQIILTLMLMAMSITSFSTATTFPPPIAKPGCSDSCGDVKIPYPFGLTKNCSLDTHYWISCTDSHDYNSSKAFLEDSLINITKVSLEGQLHILKFIERTCFNDLKKNGTNTITLPKFTINSTVNKFTAVGCNTIAFAQGNRPTREKYTTGCISICENKIDVISGSCSGGGCCQTSIPNGMSKLSIIVGSYYSYNNTDFENFSPCSYAFVVDEGKFNFSFENLTNLYAVKKLPMVLDWAIGDQNDTCETAEKNSTSYACQNNTFCKNVEGNHLGYRCFCKEGYQGNPYLPNIGCQDIDECQTKEKNDCTFKELCQNFQGGYNCSCPKDYNLKGDGKGHDGCIRKIARSNQLLVARILSGIAIGFAILLVSFSWIYFGIRRRKLMLMREKFFEDNGGLLLQQKLRGQEGSSKTTKIFGDDELKKATDNFHERQIIGQGGFGIVYKGCLTDNNKVIAIKKAKTIDRNQIEQFINEVVILSQVHHNNVVRLLGCCLETQVPLLVFEFINNGTLFNHLHDKDKAREMCWDIRLKIAAETAEALSYLHSAVSPPIIHRDIKTMNILLDENYTAKVSDFGASRLGPLDETQLSTMVQGTRGYLDPEFFQTFQLTEKSDVYSFGVVLVELLTGKKPICFDRSENERNLANMFISLFKENQLFDILDDCMVSEKNIEQIKHVAVLAKRCLNVKGEDRPCMKEVAMELVGLRLTSKDAWIQSAQPYQEELEPLIHERQSDASNVGNIMLTSTYYGVENQIIASMADGR